MFLLECNYLITSVSLIGEENGCRMKLVSIHDR